MYALTKSNVAYMIIICKADFRIPFLYKHFLNCDHKKLFKTY